MEHPLRTHSASFQHPLSTHCIQVGGSELIGRKEGGKSALRKSEHRTPPTDKNVGLINESKRIISGNNETFGAADSIRLEKKKA